MESAERLFLHALILRAGGKVTITNAELEAAQHRAVIVDRDGDESITIDLGPKVVMAEVAERINEKPWK